MTTVRTTLAALAVLLAVALTAAEAGPGWRRDQDAAYAAARAGQARPLHEIEGRILPRVQGADYLGPEFDPGSATYRLKFMRNGSVFWLDVDARTGAVIGRSGW